MSWSQLYFLFLVLFFFVDNFLSSEKVLLTRKRVNMGKTPEEIREEEELQRIHQIVQGITDMAKFLGTEDMYLAGIVYLASIVRRRKRSPFRGVEVHRVSSS